MDQKYEAGPQPESQEVKENLEAIKEAFTRLNNSLVKLVDQLKGQGVEGNNFAKGLNLEYALQTINWNKQRLFPEDRASANNFTFMLYPSGIIHQLARAYARIKAFYQEGSRFQEFCKEFESFIYAVNHNNTTGRIKVPELLVPMDQKNQVLDASRPDYVEKEYKVLPGVCGKVINRMREAREGEKIVVDFSRISFHKVQADGVTERQGTEAVTIATPAFWY